jgi:hypothetical protein
MKTYPTIPGLTPKIRAALEGRSIYLFRKEDGSNIRVEWNSKQGFYKYGRRNGLLDDSNPILKEAPALFEAKYAKGMTPLCQHLCKAKGSSVTIYFEFFGDNSRFGHHVDEPHDVQIFDICTYKKGFLDPPNFNAVMTPWNSGLVWAGKFDQDILDQVRDGSLPGISFEGVVGKSSDGDFMFKYKCQRWYDSLKEHCGDNQDLYNILK